MAFLIACLPFLSASSVTEHVLITQISACCPFLTLVIPELNNCLPIAEVSAKFNLHPSV